MKGKREKKAARRNRRKLEKGRWNREMKEGKKLLDEREIKMKDKVE